MKLNIKGLANQVMRFATKHAPAMFTGAAAAGVVATTIMGIKATPKAVELLKEREKTMERKTTVPEKIQTCWKTYLPTAIMGSLTIGAVIAGHCINEKRLAAMCALYSMAENRVKALQNTVKKELSPQKQQLIEAESTNALESGSSYSEEKVIPTGRGSTLTYDNASGRYFYSDRESIRQAENDMNSQIINENYACLNEFYYSLNLPGIKLGDIIGWNTGELMKIHFGSKLTENGTPCMVIDYVCKPLF